MEGKMKTRSILAVLAVLLVSALLAGFFLVELPTSTKDLILVVTGAIIGVLKDVYGYFFGSSLDGNGHDTHKRATDKETSNAKRK